MSKYSRGAYGVRSETIVVRVTPDVKLLVSNRARLCNVSCSRLVSKILELYFKTLFNIDYFDDLDILEDE